MEFCRQGMTGAREPRMQGAFAVALRVRRWVVASGACCAAGTSF